MSERRDVRSISVVLSDDAAGQRSRIAKGAALIVAAYVANNSIPHSGLPALITLVAQSLTDAVASQRQDATSTTSKATESEIRASIQRDRLISFVDGKPYKALRRHLRFKGFSPQSYRMIYGLPADYPMVAPSYSELRSQISKEIGAKQRRLSWQG
jgi:predicted transcriptional regulator